MLSESSRCKTSMNNKMEHAAVEIKDLTHTIKNQVKELLVWYIVLPSAFISGVLIYKLIYGPQK